MQKKKPPYVVRPPTAILTRGFDPRLSVGVEDWRDLLRDIRGALESI